MYLILFGAPGVGKGTQAKLISKHHNVPQISTGDMLREAARKGTELGNKAKQIMARGELVPDDLMLKIIKNRITQSDCAHGFILDGFPRTIPQAEGLAGLMKELNLPPLTCIEIQVPEAEIVKRLSSRKVCEACGADYNPNTNPAPADNICTKCGGNIVTRKDDSEETIKNRLRVYRQKTEKVKEYYRERGRFYTIDGNKPVEEVYHQIDAILQ